MIGLVLLALTAGLHQEAGQEPTRLPDVVVTPRPATPEVARQFVARVSDAPVHANSLATWRRPICIEVVNLGPQASLVLTAQIAGRAQNLGVEVNDGDCQPNLLVVATADGRRTASELVEGAPGSFRMKTGVVQHDRSALRRFQETTAPVRWWTMSADFDSRTGRFLQSFSPNPVARTGSPTVNMGTIGGLVSVHGVEQTGELPPGRNTTGDVFFNQNLARAMIRTVVVVDASLTGDAPIEALGDYIAMVALAEIDPEADTRGYPTILNLWTAEGSITGLTEWDEAYLEALYAAGVRQPGGATLRSRFQFNEIARGMSRRGEAADD